MTIASPPLVKQRRSRDPELTQNLILKATTDAFAMHGFEGATLPKIAASAGVSTPLLVHYFNRSEEHTSELQSLMRHSYAVFCLTKKKTPITHMHNLTPSHILNNNHNLHTNI